jgi:hypothetical protein
MRIVKRRVVVNGERYDIWLGLVNKGYRGKANYHLYYYVGDPDNEFHQPQALKTGFKSEDEAIEFGKNFMTNLLSNALSRGEKIAQSKD